MIRVWSDRQRAGVLDRFARRGSTFAYDPAAPSQRAISVTMPVQTASYNWEFGLAPVFQMNLPEGLLRERLMRTVAKAAGASDDFDLLALLGRTQIGRLRYSVGDADLSENVPYQSIDEILHPRPGAGDLLEYLLETFAAHSGLSGIQPKVMIRTEDARLGDRQSQSFRTATHIVKLWDPDEYPELAANEFFCLKAAQAMGLAVPKSELSDDGKALVLERFDLANGTYLGFEDFCVLNALPTAEKYKGGYETRLFKRLRDYVPQENQRTASEQLFQLFVLNCAVRNGDAHLKNFGILYRDVNGAADLAPVYDIVTTSAYFPKDTMALTLGGSTRWPDRRALVHLGQVRADLSLRWIENVLEATADAMASVAPSMRAYFRQKGAEVGERIAHAWETGISESLGLAGRSRPKRATNAPRR